MDLIWRSGSREHDWEALGQATRLVETFVELGLVGDADWRGDDYGQSRAPAPVPADELPGTVGAWLREGKGDGVVTVGGSNPAAWDLDVLVSSGGTDSPASEGPHVASLRFQADLDTVEECDRLFEAFVAVHGPDDTEFAFVHPYPHFMHLCGDVYRPPLVNTQMVAGAYGALFVGPGQLEFFDADALAAVPATDVRRSAGGVWIRGLSVLADAPTPAGEQRLRELTELMRATLL